MKKNDRVKINSGGGPVFLGKVKNQGIIKGRSDIYNSGLKAEEVTQMFNDLFETIKHHSRLSTEDKDDLRIEIEELRKELGKKEKANESFLLRRLRNIKRMAPDILEVTLATITNTGAGFGVIAKKVAEKIKASSG